MDIILESRIKDSSDVLIFGAGIAGLAAVYDMSAEGLNVCVIEARDRIGERICTRRDEQNPLAVELGAEFIHGRPPEIFEIAKAARLLVCDVTEHHWSMRDRVLSKSNEFWSKLEEIMDGMKKAGGRDQSFVCALNLYGGASLIVMAGSVLWMGRVKTVTRMAKQTHKSFR